MNPAPLVSQFTWYCIGGSIVIAGDVAVVKTIAAAVAPAPEPPQSTSGSVVMSQMAIRGRSEEHTSELQSRLHLVCRLLLEKKKTILHLTPLSTLQTCKTRTCLSTPTARSLLSLHLLPTPSASSSSSSPH